MTQKNIPIATILSGGDLRSKGRSEEVVAIVEDDNARFSETIDCLFLPDLIIQTRAADAIEKITRTHPEWLSQVQKRIIPHLPDFENTKILQMHIAMLLGRMNLNAAEIKITIPRLKDWALQDKYTFTRVASMQAFCDQAMKHPSYRTEAKSLVRAMMKNASAAIASRGRKLLDRLD